MLSTLAVANEILNDRFARPESPNHILVRERAGLEGAGVIHDYGMSERHEEASLWLRTTPSPVQTEGQDPTSVS